MAYTALTAFEVKATNAVFDEIANISGKYQVSNADAICSAGWLCKRGARLANAGYTGITNTNAYIMGDAVSTDDAATGIYACNPFDVNEVTDPTTGAIRRVGANTLGLPAPAGRITTYTKIDFASNDKIYRFGIGNANAALSTNTFFTIADGQLAPAASAPATAGAVYFELIGTGTFTQGAYAAAQGSTAFTYIDVMARTVV